MPPPFNRGRVVFAAIVWLSFLPLMGIIGFLSNLPNDLLDDLPTWWNATMVASGIAVAVLFLIYNLQLLVSIMTGYFHKR